MDETTASLATFGSELTMDDLPDEVIVRVKSLLADALASALSGWASPQSSQIATAAERLYGPGGATVIGAHSASPAAATLINGYLVTARSVCDVHQPTLCHVTPVLVPPVICLAESEVADGSTLLVALAVGMETTVRIGLGLRYLEFRSRGWHSPGVAGLIGASVGAARVLGLDRRATEEAMGIAGSQAGGTFASFGTPTIKFHQARAAQAALLAASLARESFRGPSGILTNPDGGVFTTFSDGGDPSRTVEDLGDRWELMEITTRLWPAAAALQSILTIIDEEPIPDVSMIDGVLVALPPKSFEMNAHIGWGTLFEATLSARFATSLALHARSFWELSDGALGEQGVVDLAERVSVVEDKELPEGGARLGIRSAGHERNWVRHHPRGSPEAPASWGDVAEKMHVAGDGLLGQDRVDRVLRAVENLESVSDVTQLLAEIQAVKSD